MYSQILVPVDGSTASTCALREAIKIAKSQGSQLRLLHIVKAPMLDYGFASGDGVKDAIVSLTRVERRSQQSGKHCSAGGPCSRVRHV